MVRREALKPCVSLGIIRATISGVAPEKYSNQGCVRREEQAELGMIKVLPSVRNASKAKKGSTKYHTHHRNQTEKGSEGAYEIQRT